MPGELNDFGLATEIHAEAIGAPGQRRFRLAVQNEEASAALWLEKEQIAALGSALEQQLVRTGGVRRRAEESQDAAPPFPADPSFDLQVRQLALGYDDERQLFVLQIFVADSEAEERASFGCTVQRDQAHQLTREIEHLMQTGRPICQLCGAPMEGIHVCPRSNGHAQVTLR